MKLSRLLAGLILTTVAPLAVAQAWPSKPIKWVAPFPPGGTTDLIARLLAQRLTEQLGQNVFIENRGGAGGSIGADVLAKSAPDGYTMGTGTVATHAINAALYKKLSYHPVNDFVPITLVGLVPNLLTVHPSVPAKNVKELIALLKANPGTATFSSSGNGSAPHLSGELFKTMAGVDMQHIPYKGTMLGITDVVAGRVTLAFANFPVTYPLAQTGKLRALAVTTAKRSAAAPDIPTISESGLPNYEVSSWQGVFVPAGTPLQIVKRLNAELVKIINTAQMKETLVGYGVEPSGNSVEEFSAMVKAEVAKWARVVKQSGAQLD